MKLSKQEYGRLVKELEPKSPMGKDLLGAFLIGGLICTVGQGISCGFSAIGMDETKAAGATSVAMILLSAILTAFSVYDDLAKHGGAGTLVPITGFSNAVVSPAMEFRTEGFVLGVGAKIFVIAGPVIVYGVCASVIYGLILAILQML